MDVAIGGRGRGMHLRLVGDPLPTPWALGALDPRWHGLVQSAIDDRPDRWGRVGRPADPELLTPTRRFADHALAYAEAHAAAAAARERAEGRGRVQGEVCVRR